MGLIPIKYPLVVIHYDCTTNILKCQYNNKYIFIIHYIYVTLRDIRQRLFINLTP